MFLFLSAGLERLHKHWLHRLNLNKRDETAEADRAESTALYKEKSAAMMEFGAE